MERTPSRSSEMKTAEVKAALASVVRRREAVLRAAAAGGDEVLKSLAVKIIEEECS